MVRWSEEKNAVLKERRGISFEQALVEIEAGRVLGLIPHPTKPNQQIYIIRLDGYACNVPFVVDENGTIFLKTIYRTRKGQKHFGGEL
jgi:hypothetical protein